MRKEIDAAGIDGSTAGGDDEADISAGKVLISSEEDAASRGRLLLVDFMDDIQGVDQVTVVTVIHHIVMRAKFT